MLYSCGCVIIPDPVKAERYEDGVLRARERMQSLQDERAAEYQQKAEEVGAGISPNMTGIHDMCPDVVVSCVLYVNMGPDKVGGCVVLCCNVVENRCLTWVPTWVTEIGVEYTFGWWGIVCYILYWDFENGCQEFQLGFHGCQVLLLVYGDS